jgi:hypothetical protein
MIPEGKGWAVMHGGGYLGFVGSQAEALAVISALLEKTTATN